jgi:hypothetical protein
MLTLVPRFTLDQPNKEADDVSTRVRQAER